MTDWDWDGLDQLSDCKNIRTRSPLLNNKTPIQNRPQFVQQYIIYIIHANNNFQFFKNTARRIKSPEKLSLNKSDT